MTQQDEITRLRAEVERLKGDLLSLGATETADGGLKLNMPRYHAAHRCERHRKEPWRSQDLDKCVVCLERERDEALAQVAVLLDFCRGAMLDTSGLPIASEARALLDRLQRAEVIEAALRDALTMYANGGFVGDNVDRWINTVTLFALPKREEAR